MIYFENWWSLGENCIIHSEKGIIADDQNFEDTCIFKEEDMDKFINSIAVNVYVKTQNGSYAYEPNKEDKFLNKKINIDFDKNLLFIFRGTEIKELIYSKIFQCYMVTFSDKSVENFTYLAIVAKKFPEKEEDVHCQLMNTKPPYLKTLIPKNYNDEY